MLNIENLTNLTLNQEFLEEIANFLLKDSMSREIDLTICDNKTIQSYNREYRGKDSATDVLSFPIESDIIIGSIVMPLGSIVISADYVQSKSIEFNHTEAEELSLLFTHGVLHLLGFDHEIDSGEMRKKEEEIIYYFNLPKSLIIRTEEE
jgi:probable rRNA maturation factor